MGSKAVLSGIGHFVPSNVLTNDFFEKLDIGSDSQWIEDRVGIKERRTVLELEDIIRLKNKETDFMTLKNEGKIPSIADMSEKAWKMFIERTKTDYSHPEYILCAGSIWDIDAPANACLIGERLQMSSSVGLDVNSACSSFVAGLQTAKSFVESGTVNTVGLFTADRYTARSDYTERNNSILFGDSASACVISNNHSEGFEIVDTMMGGDPTKWEVVHVPYTGHVYQNGRAVQKFAVTRTVEMTRQILERNNLSVNDLSYFIGHQANYRMLLSSIDKLGIDESRHLYNATHFGNQAGSGAPVVLSMNWEKFKSGDTIVITVVGAGLTWASVLLKKI